MRRLREYIGTLIGGYPLNDAASRRVSPLMIIGCGRSGNTLLRSMLVAGGGIAIPPESYVWPGLVEEFPGRRFAPWPEVADWAVEKFRHSDFDYDDADFDRLKQASAALPAERRSLASILDEIYRFDAAKRGHWPGRWGDKTPLNTLHLDSIARLFPYAQYIHIVRDPRAVALSRHRAASISPTMATRSFDEIIDRWLRSVDNARQLRRRLGPSRVFELRYEDLIADPGPQLEAVCRFADLKYSAAMLAFHDGASNLGDVMAFAHHENVRKPLDQSRGEAWRNDIPADVHASVSKRTQKLRTIYGYPD